MSDFADLRDGGRRLAPLVAGAVADEQDPLLLPLLPNGVPVVLGMRESLVLPVAGLPAERTDLGVQVTAPEGVAGRCVVVVDDGVETGTAARAAVAALREAGAGRVVLAVPVCPREALADLQHRYDEVVAVIRPLARRALTWHYANFDTIDEASARRLLDDLPGGMA